MSAFGAILRNEVRLVRKTPIVVVMILILPLIVISILRATMREALGAGGIEGVTGAEQAVPGQTLLFGFFLTAAIGLSFFREHGWGTWYRLRASRASTFQVIVGKALPWSVVGLLQITIIFGISALLFDLNLPGSDGLVGVALISLTWIAFVTAFGVAMVGLLSSIQAVNSAANLGSLLFSALGGAIVPSALLPGWAETLGPLVPTHYAMEGYQRVFLSDLGWGDVVSQSLVLLGFAALFTILAARTLTLEKAKTYWA